MLTGVNGIDLELLPEVADMISLGLLSLLLAIFSSDLGDNSGECSFATC